ncbi:MAG: Gfo/Idh/MocA family oxidoreductase [Ruminococcaceae bacterium]|nr:Gfo/Idh/MocA family oxidoreductase [Oscillospiraceae bacterium]
MLKMGLVGLGGMGRGHLTQLEKLMADGVGIELVALCDIDPKAFGKVKTSLNLEGMEKSDYDFSKYHCYDNVDEMLANEKLDLVNVVVPTYEHSTVACKVMNAGVNCLCEKPMAISISQCQLMIDTAKKNNVRLMIGQCLRFWGEWVVLKDFFTSGRLGAPIGGFYYRNGGTPTKDWYLCREKGGGALFDQHIHDVDMVNYLYGVPKAVSTVGKIVIPGSGYDTCATNYIYDENYCVHTENLWVNHESGFRHGFRADFEEGTVVFDEKGFRAFSKGYKAIDLPAVPQLGGHYPEIKYFVELIENNGINTINPPESSLDTIRIALAEAKSADLGGAIVEL